MPYIRPGKGPKPRREAYPSDLTEAEWLLIEPLLPRRRTRGQPRIHSYRELLNGVLYVLREGVKWRALPHDLPPWSTVYAYFRDWQDDGTWKRLHDTLRRADRGTSGRDAEASAGSIDSRTVRTTEAGGERGYDGGKRMSVYGSYCTTGLRRGCTGDSRRRCTRVFRPSCTSRASRGMS